MCNNGNFDTLFFPEGGQTLQQKCTNTGDLQPCNLESIQNSTAQSPEQPIISDPAVSEVLDHIALYFQLKFYPSFS